MIRLITYLTLFIIATIPILFAAVEPWVWSIYGLMMILAFLLFVWSTDRVFTFPQFDFSTSLIVVFFIWAFVQCLPLPFAVVSVVSSMRTDLFSQAQALNESVQAGVSFSYLPKIALSWWVFLIGLVCFFIVVRELSFHRKVRHRIIMIMIAVGLAESIYGLIQALVPSMGVLWVDYIHSYLGTARGTFINRNNFAGYLEMIWPLALGVALSMTGRATSLKEALNSDKINRQALMAMGIILLLMALIFTRSRGGIISGIAGFLVFFTLARREMQAVARQTRWLLGGIASLLIVYMMVIGIGPILQRFLSIRGDSASRMEIWRDSLPMIKDHPFGIGLGNYETVFALYNQSSISNKTVVFAHNDYLQLLIETGWIGFFALSWFFVLFFWKNVRRIKQMDCRKDPLTFYLAVGAFSGLTSMAVHSLFDFNLQIPANCLYFIVLMAVLSACTNSTQKQSQKWSAPEKARPGKC